MSKKCIIFDLDGTIVDSMPILRSFVEHEGLLLDERDISALRDLPAGEALGRLGIGMWKLPYFAWRFRGYFRESLPKAVLISGIEEAVRRLYDEGHTLGVLTTNSRSNAIAVLERGGIGSRFSFVKSERNTFGKSKALRRIVNGYAMKPETVWYVGDEVRDMVAAREAGLRSLAVTWGFNSEKALRAANPDEIISRPDDLESVISRVIPN
ncbi:MAG: HAD-IA family hydrolase [Candidatus Moranbacteria bacterium]|nr:HAD-IA family hydrolase [Candidatus Moranbacteria bacterium]